MQAKHADSESEGACVDTPLSGFRRTAPAKMAWSSHAVRSPKPHAQMTILEAERRLKYLGEVWAGAACI